MSRQQISGALIRETRSSKYSGPPSKHNRSSAGKKARATGGERVPGTGQDRREQNSRESDSSFDKLEMESTNSSGSNDPDRRIPESRGSTRSPADRSRFGNVGNGMPCKWKNCRCGEDPPKKVSGKTGARTSIAITERCFNPGNGTSIADKTVSNGKLG